MFKYITFKYIQTLHTFFLDGSTSLLCPFNLIFLSFVEKYLYQDKNNTMETLKNKKLN